MVVLDRQIDRVSWRGVEVAAAGEAAPAPREKHSLTALSGGRLLMFGGAPQYVPLCDVQVLCSVHLNLSLLGALVTFYP